jgi:hypothetical protein
VRSAAIFKPCCFLDALAGATGADVNLSLQKADKLQPAGRILRFAAVVPY